MTRKSLYAWDSRLYDGRHSIITRYGEEIVAGMLSPRAGERILDLGCGTGHLTNQIAESGAEAVGLDASPAMVEEARRNYPRLEFVQADARDFRFDEPFDAVFSNAALHWIQPPEPVIACVAASLKEGGRFVAEFGGKGNIRLLIGGVRRVMAAMGHPMEPERMPWYFPGIAEYGTLLERHGLSLVYAALFPRPTPQEGGESGLRSWMEMFGQTFLSAVPEAERVAFFQRLEEELRPTLFHEGAWRVDYQRLRFVAVKAPLG
ncbi:MAG: methyltransferase domain-containing protein [Armatimonadetes bacterium]|nr:methyltransferase domain-containing protein [Armatimonadota bacterium]